MVPYVRKSFYKHYKEGMRYLENVNIKEIEEKYHGFTFDSSTPIDSDIYHENEKTYQYAMDMTIKEIRQAVEGMYHNLNY